MAAFTYTVAQYEIETKPFTGTDTITIADTQSILEGLSAAKIAEFVTNNVDIINSLDNVLSWNVAQWGAAVPQLSFDDDDFLILSDSGAAIGAASASLIGQIAAAGATLLSPTDGEVTLSLAQYNALGGMSIDTDADGTLSDTGTNLETLTVGQIGALALKGVDVIDASDDEWSLSVAKFQALGDVALTEDDEVTLFDLGANIESLSVAELEAISHGGVDIISFNDQIQITVEQYGALAGLDFAGSGVRIILDTGANIAALNFAGVDADGFDLLNATDDKLTISLTQYNQLGDIELASGDEVTLSDSGTALSALNASQLSGLAGDNIDIIDANSGSLAWTLAELAALGTVSLTDSDTVVAEDSQANLEALSAGDIENLSDDFVDTLDSTDNALRLTVAQTRAVLDNAITLTGADTATVSDTAANIQGLTAVEIAALAGDNFDLINSSDDALALSKAQYLALGAVQLTAADVNTLLDTGANIASLTSAQFALLDNNRIDFLDANDNALDLTVAQYSNLGTTALTGGDTVTLKDTAAALQALTYSDYSLMGGAGVDKLDSTDNVLSLNIANALIAQAGGVTLTAGDVVTVLDTAANIEALTGGQITMLSAMGVDFLDSSTTGYALTVDQASAMGSGAIKAVAADTVSLVDTGANIAAMTSSMIAGLGPDNIDLIDSNTDSLNLNTAQYVQLGTVALTLADDITLADTGANLAALSDVQYGGLAAKGIDQINATNNSLALTVAQYRALGAVNLTGADVVTLRDSGANLGTLSNAEISALAGKKIDAIDATDNVLSISIAQFNALGSVQLASGDVVTLSDTSANIEALSAAQLISLGGKGVDKIDATDNVLTLTVNKYLNLGSVTLVGADVVTLADTGANIEALTLSQFGALNGNGVDVINTTDNVLNLTVAKAVALNGVSVHASDSFVIRDSAANLEALTSSEIAALAAAGVDQFNANGTATVNLTAADVAALGTISLANGDTWVLNDTGANIAALTATQIGALAGKGVDSIDASDNALSLSVAQYRALGALTLNGADAVILRDTGANLGGLSEAELGFLAGNGVDKLDATNDILTLTAGQLEALSDGLMLTEADFVTLVGAGADIADLGDDEYGGTYDDSIGYVSFVDRINATDNVLTVTLEQVDFFADENIALTQTDLVTVHGSQADLQDITAGEFAAYANQGVDVFDSDDGTLALTAAKASAIVNSGLLLESVDEVYVYDSSANIMASLGALLDELGGAGFDYIDTTDDELNLTVAQATGLSVNIHDSDWTTVVDTSANIEAMTAAQFEGLVDHGVDEIDATDDELNLLVAQFLAGMVASETGPGHAREGLDANPGGDSLSYANEDEVRLLDTGAHIQSMSASEMSTLGRDGVDSVDATDNVLNLSVQQLRALLDMPEVNRVAPLSAPAESAVTLTGNDLITLYGTGDQLDNLSASEINTMFAAGVDTFDLTDGSVTLNYSQYQAFTAHGSFTASETVTIVGGSGANAIVTGKEKNLLDGMSGNDSLTGGGGIDTLHGGKGEDFLSGGNGADVFMFAKLTDSNNGQGVDRIMDLGNGVDTIDLSGIDASNKVSGDQAFTLVAALTGVAGQLAATYNSAENLTTFSGDTNGDGVADLVILAVGNHLTFDDFVL